MWEAPAFCRIYVKRKAPHISVRCFLLLVEITGLFPITVTLLQSMHGALPAELNPHSFGVNKKGTAHFCAMLFFLVEITGIEPVTSCMPCKRSPS